MDREKVISGWERCRKHTCLSIDSKEYADCEYTVGLYCRQDLLIDDTLALLKEQEAKPMIENERGWNCPSCGMNLIGKSASGYPCALIDLPEDEPIHFCPMCGQAVKWE